MDVICTCKRVLCTTRRPSAPGFFGNYTVDIPMATFRCTEWEQVEEEYRKRLQQAKELGEQWTSWVSRNTKERKQERRRKA